MLPKTLRDFVQFCLGREKIYKEHFYYYKELIEKEGSPNRIEDLKYFMEFYKDLADYYHKKVSVFLL